MKKGVVMMKAMMMILVISRGSNNSIIILSMYPSDKSKNMQKLDRFSTLIINSLHKH